MPRKIHTDVKSKRRRQREGRREQSKRDRIAYRDAARRPYVS